MLTRLEVINGEGGGGGVADSFLLFLAGVGSIAFTAGVEKYDKTRTVPFQKSAPKGPELNVLVWNCIVC